MDISRPTVHLSYNYEYTEHSSVSLVMNLKGHNALIQIQVDGQYVIKHIGDVNKLVNNPTLITYKEDSSFLGWMEGEIDKETYTPGTIANHRAALVVLRRFKKDMTFTQIDYKCICDFENFLKKRRVCD